MTDLVPVRKGKPTQISLADLQERLDARSEIAKNRSTTSTKKSRIEEAEKVFRVNPYETLVEIQILATNLADLFDDSISVETTPLSQADVDQLSEEFSHLERLKAQIVALETRYRELIFSHLDKTSTKVPGRPASQVPGKVEASGPGQHYVFERRGGNREAPELDTEGLREALPEEIAAQIYVTVHHDPVPAWDEKVFDEAKFGELVDSGIIDLDVVAKYLTPGSWRTPSFYKTLVGGAEV